MTIQNKYDHFAFDAPLAPVDAFARFPALAQSGKAPVCSEKYVHIDTRDIALDMHAHNFDLVGVTIQRKRDVTRQDYAAHMLRWRYRGAVDASLGDVASFDVIGMNSHDTSRAFIFAAGMTVRACLNSCIWGETFERFKVYHSANGAAKVADGIARMLAHGPAIAARVDAMRARVLSDDTQIEFATRALALRYPEIDAAPVSPLALLTAKRDADNGATLWQTFNKAQEHLLRGGLSQVSIGDNGRARKRSIRAVRGIDSNVKLNGALLDLALEYA